jgi:Zn-dependent M16 (insulinase) family peptidase
VRDAAAVEYEAKLTGARGLAGPLVHGHFILATEALDDDGCPHTLEHLIFLGSAQFPYKGVLDRLANRALAQGTNAWTDVDHTCYTVGHTGPGAEADHVLMRDMALGGGWVSLH